MVDKAIQELLHKVISSNPRGVMVIYTTADGGKWVIDIAGYENRDMPNLTSYAMWAMRKKSDAFFSGQRQSDHDQPPVMQGPQRSELPPGVPSRQVHRAVQRAIKKKSRKVPNAK